jgi:hypothetical protein
MEKLVFLFRRKPGTTHEAYCDHYLTVHAPLGMRLMHGLNGYTVNLLETAAEFDAVTEIWTPAIADFLAVDPTTRPGTIEEIQKDHFSFMGPQDTYAVDERIVRDGPLTSPLGAPTPGVKAISLHRKGEAPPDPPAGAYRVVDNVVLRPILLQDQFVDGATGVSSNVAVIRSVWAGSADDLGPLPPGAMLVREHRNRLAAG